MPLQLSNAAIQQFMVDFQLKYQEAERLANCAQNMYDLRGDAYKIPYMGQVATVARGAYQSQIPASDQDIEQKTISFSNFTLNLPLDYFQSMEVSKATNTLASLSDTHSKAMARRSDQVLIDALDADPGDTIADGGTNISVDKIKQAKSLMDDNAVDESNRFLIVTPSQIDALLI